MQRRTALGLALGLSLATASTALADPVQLSVWTRMPEEAGKVFFDAFEKAHPDIDLQVEYIPGGKNHINKLIAAVAAGTPPDFSTLDVVATERFARMGALLSLDDVITQNKDLALDLFPQGPLATGRFDGVQYALPFGGDASVIPYNKALFRERGLDPEKPPRTWAEFHEAASKLTFDKNGDGKPDTYGMMFIPAQPSLTTFYWLPYFWMAGGEFNDREKKVFTFNSEAGVTALTHLMDLHLKLKAVPPSAIGAVGTADNLIDFLQGRVAMAFAGPDVIRRVGRDMPSLELGIMQHPSPGPDVPSTTFSGGDNVAIMSKIPDEKLPAAMTLMTYLVSVDAQRLWQQTKYFLPVRRELLSDPYYDTHPLDKTVLDAFLKAHEPPQTSHYVEVQQYLRDAFEEVAHGLASPQQALDRAVQRGNALVRRTGLP